MSRNRQGGFTLIELIIASAIGLVVMTGLASVVYTAYQADRQATNRVEASGEIRTFQETAYRDFAFSSLPRAPGTPQDPIRLGGCMMSSADGGKTFAWSKHTVTYTWNAAADAIQRQVDGGAPYTLDTDISNFSWNVDSTSQTVVVTLTVTLNTTYTQTQTLRFYPRVVPVSQLPQNVDAPCNP